MLVDDVYVMYIKFGFSMYMMLCESLIFCGLIQTNPQEGKRPKTNKISGCRDVTSISFPRNKDKAKKNKLKVYSSDQWMK